MQIRPKFGKILKKSQTKYLRPSHFWKRPNCYDLAAKRSSFQLCLGVHIAPNSNGIRK